MPNIIEVKRAKSSASNMRKRRKTTVAGGEKTVQVFQSPWMQVMKWLMARTRAWKEMTPM